MVGSGPGTPTAPAERRRVAGAVQAVALAAMVAIVAFGVFRNGAIFAEDRDALAVVMGALGLALIVRSAVTSVVHGGRADAWGLYLSLSLPGRVAAGGLVVLTGLSVLSAAWSLAPEESLWAGYSYVGAVVSFLLGAGLWSTRWTRAPLLVPVLTLLGAGVAWVSVVGFGLGWPSYLGVLQGQTHAQGPFGYANALAGLIVLTLPSSAWLAWWSGGGRLTRLFAGAAVVFQLWALVLTRSRGAALALVGAAVLLAVVRGVRSLAAMREARWRRTLAVALSAGFVLILTAAGTVVWREARPFVVGPDIHPVGAVGALPEHVEGATVAPMTTDGFRIRNWMAAGRAIAERPLVGYGIGTFYQAYAPFKPGAQTRYAHDLLVQYGVELGSLGVLVLLVTVLAVAAACLGCAWRGGRSAAGIWVGVSVIGFLMQNVIDLTWYFPALLYVFWFCVGAVSVASASGPDGNGRGRMQERGRGGGDAMQGG